MHSIAICIFASAAQRDPVAYYVVPFCHQKYIFVTGVGASVHDAA